MKNDRFAQKAADICSRLTTDEKLSFICTHQENIDRFGLEEFAVGAEIARGFVGREPEKYSTVFPQPVGLAGTFDKELMSELGEIAGNESRAYFNDSSLISPCMWGPTVDMERHPLWGRTEEAYGEDVCLAGEMTRAYTESMAADNGEYVKVIPTLKHFCANNNEINRGGCDVFLPARLKHEYYYAAFMNAIRFGGAKSVMASYNEVNGLPMMCDPVLRDMLKEQWGLWFIVTDGGDFAQTVTMHRYCASHAETVAESIKAGCDIMTDDEFLVKAAAKKALEDGLLTEAELDRAVQNVLYMRLRLGKSDENCPYNNIGFDVLEDKNSAEVCLRAAREQVVLLKNDGLLPIRRTPRKIAVLGALSDENLRDWYTGYFHDAVSVVEGIRREFPDCEVVTDRMWDIISIKAPNGRYLSVHEDGIVRADSDSITDSELFELRRWGGNWDNLFSVKYNKYVAYKNDTLRLLNRNVYSWFTAETFNIGFSGDNIVIDEYLHHFRLVCNDDGSLAFAPHFPVDSRSAFTMELYSQGSERGEALAENSDLVVFCTGNDPIQFAKEDYDRSSLKLSVQSGFAEQLRKINHNVVMVLISSYPCAIVEENETLPAIIYTTHAGAHLGTAVAETISGRNNPAGRLAMTWYSSDLDLPDIMEYDIEKSGSTYMYFRGTPLYPFGYGLSYSEFAYTSLNITPNPDGTLTADVTLQNTSDCDGEEVVQLYFTVTDSKVSRPIKKLCAFERVRLRAGEEATVRRTVKPHILEIFDIHTQRMIRESGTYKFMVGGSSADTALSAETVLTGDTVGMRGSRFEGQFFDDYVKLSVGYSHTLGRYYARSLGWSGVAVYNGLDLTAASAVKLKISAVMGGRTIHIIVGGKDYELDVKPTLASDDFIEYTLPVTPSDSDSLVICLGKSMGLLDIEIIGDKNDKV